MIRPARHQKACNEKTAVPGVASPVLRRMLARIRFRVSRGDLP
jgi:hypothetical protein